MNSLLGACVGSWCAREHSARLHVVYVGGLCGWGSRERVRVWGGLVMVLMVWAEGVLMVGECARGVRRACAHLTKWVWGGACAGGLRDVARMLRISWGCLGGRCDGLRL